MSRRKIFVKKRICVDAKYHSVLVFRFINNVMKHGKRSLAEKIIYGVLDKMKLRMQDPIKIFHKSLDNVKPQVELNSLRVGGSTYQVPTIVKEFRGYALAIKWIISCALKKKGDIINKIYDEMLDAFYNKGLAIKMKDNLHKMAEANKAFSHLSQRKN